VDLETISCSGSLLTHQSHAQINVRAVTYRFEIRELDEVFNPPDREGKAQILKSICSGLRPGLGLIMGHMQR
jgi:hypothetical protein